MEYVAATADMANAIHDILHATIKTIYPKYYPQEVVDFFLPASQHGAHFRKNRFWKYGSVDEWKCHYRNWML